MANVNISINGKNIEAKPDWTVLEAARAAGIHIPTLCYYPFISRRGACRLCSVELEGSPNLIASCVYPVREGLKIQTHSPRVLKARKTILELFVANHNYECLVCRRNGDCQLQSLCEEYGISEDKYKGGRKRPDYKDCSSEAYVKDHGKCILCGRCVKVCEELQDVHAIEFVERGFPMEIQPAFGNKIANSVCIDCGQCVISCPVAALCEKDSAEEVFNALSDPNKYVIVQTAPAIRVTIGEAMGLKAGTVSTGKMISGLRQLGFKQVFDTAFGADLTVMEEASELVQRIENNGKLPIMTSCSPGWTKFVETFYPEFIPNLSSCKSPHQMLGAIAKSYFAQKNNIKPENIFMVSVMPCTAKKFEINRETNKVAGIKDVDVVITTRELAKILKTGGINFALLEDSEFDNPLGFASSAGEIFGASGGVLEASLRTAYNLLTGNELEKIDFQSVRGLSRLKEASIDINGKELKVAAVSSLGEARKLIERIKCGEVNYDFVEVMACPGGCIAGGGQPYTEDYEVIKARMESLYAIDFGKDIRKAHKNPFIMKLYEDFLGEPLSEVSHKYLHTKFKRRKDVY
ncbi:MAG: ferredoxin [Candidatus Melainabacteria bacterium GWA2_34_9]|nr:MAG: ferredoxin [Candidatus Melainabacteria bacterium GWA2_34_9]